MIVVKSEVCIRILVKKIVEFLEDSFHDACGWFADHFLFSFVFTPFLFGSFRTSRFSMADSTFLQCSRLGSEPFLFGSFRTSRFSMADGTFLQCSRLGLGASRFQWVFIVFPILLEVGNFSQKISQADFDGFICDVS